MSRVIHPATLAAMANPVITWLILVRYEFDSGTLAFCNLLDDYVFEGVTYTGMGDLGNISEVVENTSLDPAYFDVTLSGIKTELLAAALNENYTNRDCYVHLGLLSQPGDTETELLEWSDTTLPWNDLTLGWGSSGGYRLIGEPFVFFYGKVSEMQCSYGENSQIVVTAVDEASVWEKPKLERYTDQDQRARYPGDTGFRFVAQLAGKNIIWPSRQWFVNRA